MTTTINNDTRSLARRQRVRLMGGASVALLTTLVPAVAQGAPAPSNGARVVVDDNGQTTMSGHVVVGSTTAQNNNAMITASIVDATAGIERSGTATGNTDTVADNRIIATAGANSFTNGDANLLSAIAGSESEFGSGDGIAMSGASLNYGTILSSVSESAIGISLIDTFDGSVSNSGNMIAANTTVNAGTSIVGGTTPSGYRASPSESGAVAGGAFTNSETEGLAEVYGTVAVSTTQLSRTAGASSASVDDVDTTLSLTTLNGGTFSGAAVLDNNSVAANFKGNQATSDVSLASSTSTFGGTASIGNVQQFEGPAYDNEFGDNVSALTDNVTIAATIGSRDFEEGNSSTTLTGSLSVSGNRISAMARGNEALAKAGGTQAYGNQIALADNTSFVGTSDGEGLFGSEGGAFSVPLGGAKGAAVAAADLVIVNNQTVQAENDSLGRRISARNDDADVAARVEAVNGASVTVGSNVIDSSATANAVSSGIMNGANSAVFDGSAAIANLQSNNYVTIAAETSDAEVRLAARDYSFEGNEGDNINSLLSVTGNRIASNAYGNDATQAISLTATTLGGGTAPAELGASFGVIAMAPAGVSNAQMNYNGNITARTDGEISLTSETSSDPSHTAFLLDANRVEAIAVGSNVANSVALTGTTIGAGAGIASLQNAINSDISADTNVDVEGWVDGDLEDGSTLSVTNNVARSVAYGANATNAFDVSGGTMRVDEAGEDQIVGQSPFGGIVAATGAYNNQNFINGTVNAALEGGIWADIGDDVLDGSTITNSSNSLVAAAYGNQAANTGALSVGSLEVNQLATMVSDNDEGMVEVPVAGNMASLAAVSNNQVVVNGSVFAESRYARINTFVDDTVESSSITSSGNLIQTAATGNRVDTNSLKVSGTSLVNPDGVDAGRQAIRTPLDAAVAVYNEQSVNGVVSAATGDDREFFSDDGVSIDVRNNVENSSLTALTNQQVANATGNVANNALSLDGSTVQTTSALQNNQSVNGGVNAVLGSAGFAAEPGTPDQPFTYTVTITDPSANCVGGASGTCNVTGGTAIVSTGSLNQEQISALIGNGWEQTEGQLTRDASYLGTMSFTQYGALTESGQTSSSFVPGMPGMPGTPNGGGVIVSVDDYVSDSVIKVANNTGTAAATGNSASNVVTVSATNLVADGSNTGAFVTQSSATADHSVGNNQDTNGVISSVSYGSFGIVSNDFESEGGLDVYNSTLDVSGNRQNATSFANTAVTSLTVAANDMSGGALSAGLFSQQTSSSMVDAMSDLDVFSPVASYGSSATLNNNANTATAVANDAINTVAAAATNVPGTVGLASNGTVSGDVALRNVQTKSGGDLLARANTVIANQEGPQSFTTGNTVYEGVVAGSVAMNGNSTLAQSAANQATNSVVLNAGANQSGGAALSSTQDNMSGVTSMAASTIGLGLNTNGGGEYGALNGSSLTITGNSTVANARGNVAVNTMTATTGAGYGQNGPQALSDASATYASAQNVVLNGQSNTAAINAVATSTTAMQALNGSVANATMTVGGNTTLASAYGNAATNTLTLSPSIGGVASGAVVNSQTNFGMVSATASNVTYSVGGRGATTGSTVGVAGNSIGATAIGNSAVSTITTGR